MDKLILDKIEEISLFLNIAEELVSNDNISSLDIDYDITNELSIIVRDDKIYLELYKDNKFKRVQINIKNDIWRYKISWFLKTERQNG